MNQTTRWSVAVISHSRSGYSIPATNLSVTSLCTASLFSSSQSGTSGIPLKIRSRQSPIGSAHLTISVSGTQRTQLLLRNSLNHQTVWFRFSWNGTVTFTAWTSKLKYKETIRPLPERDLRWPSSRATRQKTPNASQ